MEQLFQVKQPHLGRATTPPLRQGPTGTFSAVTVVMAARSDVPAKSETFPGDSSICVFPNSELVLLYSFAALNPFRMGKVPRTPGMVAYQWR